jgi:hypothetical protein
MHPVGRCPTHLSQFPERSLGHQGLSNAFTTIPSSCLALICRIAGAAQHNAARSLAQQATAQ